MKNVLLLCAFILLMVSCSPEHNQSDAWQTVLQKKSGTITLKYVSSAGFAYYQNGTLTGVTTEIFNDFVDWAQKKHEVKISVNKEPYSSWSDFYAAVRASNSGTFGMGNVTITDARWNELDFSPPYMTNIAVLITHEQTPALKKLEEMGRAFSHLKALAFQGTLHEHRLRAFKQSYFPEMQMEFAHSNNEIVQNVAESDSYFAYVDVYNFWRAKNQGAPLRQHPPADEPSEQFGYIMPDQSDWEPVIRAFFEADGGYIYTIRYEEILRTHLGDGLAELLLSVRPRK